MDTLWLLLKACFLFEVGFSLEMIEEIIKRNARYYNIREIRGQNHNIMY